MKIKNIYALIISLIISNLFFGQVNYSEFKTAENYLNSINKLFLIDFVADDYLKKESFFIKESDIIEKSWGKRNLALSSIKFLSKNNDTINYCNKGLNFNENQIVLFNIKNTINNTNFENADIKKIELLENLIKQIEALSKLDEGSKLEFRKKQLLNLCINYIKIIKINPLNSLKLKFNKAEKDAIIEELIKLPVLEESEKLEKEKRKFIEIYKNYELKIEKLIKSLEQFTTFEDNPSSDVRDSKYDDLIKEYNEYPFLVKVIEKAKKNKLAFKSELPTQIKKEDKTQTLDNNPIK